jgi:hypothetical protein
MKETMLEYLEITAKAAGFSDPRSIYEIIGAAIGVFLSMLGVIFLILMVYGGFVWMLSAGNEIKVLKAKKVLTQAVVGMIIILSSYSITRFIFDSLQNIN